MFDFDAAEEAGHRLTTCGLLFPGKALYCCERCGALYLVSHDALELFHVPPGSESTEERCSGPETEQTPLKDKLDALLRADWERLKLI
jgi:hypothetical protein